MNNILLYIIAFIHLLFMIFVIGVPLLSSSNPVLLLHLIIVPFLLAHWYTNENTCALTVIEKHVRSNILNQHNDDIFENCFTCRLIEPVYDLHKNVGLFSELMHIVVIFLWIITIMKLLKNYNDNKITCFKDLFTK